jgi:phosphoribosylanthranilate isomerase
MADGCSVTWIKICGITNLEDALTAVNAGADALGFVFYENSPRKIDPEVAREIVANLPAAVEMVGVFVDERVERIQELGDWIGLTAVQLHTTGVPLEQVTVRDLRSGSRKIIVAVRVNSLSEQPGRFEELGWLDEAGQGSPIEAILFDSGNLQMPGGTGKRFDWEKMTSLVERLNPHFHTIVAGGLNSANVAEAMRVLHPWGVDVASGVEARPGKKDQEKVKSFIAAVREADKVH